MSFQLIPSANKSIQCIDENYRRIVSQLCGLHKHTNRIHCDDFDPKLHVLFSQSEECTINENVIFAAGFSEVESKRRFVEKSIIRDLINESSTDLADYELGDVVADTNAKSCYKRSLIQCLRNQIQKKFWSTGITPVQIVFDDRLKLVQSVIQSALVYGGLKPNFFWIRDDHFPIITIACTIEKETIKTKFVCNISCSTSLNEAVIKAFIGAVEIYHQSKYANFTQKNRYISGVSDWAFTRKYSKKIVDKFYRDKIVMTSSLLPEDIVGSDARQIKMLLRSIDQQSLDVVTQAFENDLISRLGYRVMRSDLSKRAPVAP